MLVGGTGVLAARTGVLVAAGVEDAVAVAVLVRVWVIVAVCVRVGLAVAVGGGGAASPLVAPVAAEAMTSPNTEIAPSRDQATTRW